MTNFLQKRLQPQDKVRQKRGRFPNFFKRSFKRRPSLSSVRR